MHEFDPHLDRRRNSQRGRRLPCLQSPDSACRPGLDQRLCSLRRQAFCRHASTRYLHHHHLQMPFLPRIFTNQQRLCLGAGCLVAGNHDHRSAKMAANTCIQPYFAEQLPVDP
jgi:hypothetical protein